MHIKNIPSNLASYRSKLLASLAVVVLAGVVLLSKSAGNSSYDWIVFDRDFFYMGSPIIGVEITEYLSGDIEKKLSEEAPRHRVVVDPFMLMKNEVTVRQYSQCVQARVCPAPRTDPNSNYYHAGRETYPMNSIDWFEARLFCHWIGGRLPTEAEWEYAARGRGLEVLYPWGNDRITCDRLVALDAQHTCVSKAAPTQPVCSRPLGNTPQGLCDMAGNVWEWVEDLWHTQFYGPPPRSSQPWLESTHTIDRVIRGGGIASTEDYRTTHRVAHPPTFTYAGMGVRCARPVL